MLYVVSVHYASPRWIEIQARYLRQHLSVPYRTWTSLEGIDKRYAGYFDRVISQWGTHAAKLNHLALEISYQADDDDLLMFLDSDAFPIANPMPLIRDGLERAPLVAVRRAENEDEPQPHPCFCVTTIGTWRRLGGDWTAGPTWPGIRGDRKSDVGAQLWRRLELSGTPWVQVLRSNRKNLDQLYFAVYGDTIYHHGAGSRDIGSRTGKLSPVHRSLLRLRSEDHGTRGRLLAVTRVINGARWRARERKAERRLDKQSKRIYEKIRAGGSDWLSEFM